MPEKYKPLKMTNVELNKIKRVFNKYLYSFHKLQQKGLIERKNILNYHFTIREICKMVGIQAIDHYLSLPKGKKTIKNHYDIWSLIKKDNQWD